MFKTIIDKIKLYFKKRRHAKGYKKIKEGLLENPACLLKAKEKFEKSFGVNAATRTADQWKRLVKVYGVDTVSKQDHLSVDEVRKRCGETFSERTKRQFKENATKKKLNGTKS